MSDYDVVLSSQNKFFVDVNYETPLKQLQYGNLIIDDISSLFNGSTNSFTLYVNGQEYFPINEQQLIISLNGVVLRPSIDYQVSGSTLNFLIAPSDTQGFSGIALVTTADLTRTIVFVIDNGSTEIQPGSQGYITLDTNGEIDSWTLLSDDVGSIAIDIKKTSYDDYPNNFSSIIGDQFPMLINQNKNKSTNLNNWNKYLSVNDILEFEVLSASGINKCTFTIKLKL